MEVERMESWRRQAEMMYEEIDGETVNLLKSIIGELEIFERGKTKSLKVFQAMATTEELEALKQRKKELQKEFNETLKDFRIVTDFEQVQNLQRHLDEIAEQIAEIDNKINDIQKQLKKEREAVYESISLEKAELKNIKENKENIINDPNIQKYMTVISTISFHEKLIPNMAKQLKKLEAKRLREQKKEIEKKLKELKD